MTRREVWIALSAGLTTIVVQLGMTPTVGLLVASVVGIVVGSTAGIATALATR